MDSPPAFDDGKPLHKLLVEPEEEGEDDEEEKEEQEEEKVEGQVLRNASLSMA